MTVSPAIPSSSLKQRAAFWPSGTKYASKGDTVTITVTPDAGYELDALTAEDKNGKELALTDKGDGKYTFPMPGSQVTVTARFKQTDTGTENPFTDISKNDYFYDAVLWAVGRGHHLRHVGHHLQSQRLLHPGADGDIPLAGQRLPQGKHHQSVHGRER